MKFCVIIVTCCWSFSRAAPPLAEKIHENESVHQHDPNKEKELFEKLKNVHSHWYVGAVRGLLGSVGNEIYRELPPVFQQELVECLSNIVDEDDLAAGAHCVSKAFDMEDEAKSGVEWIGAFGTKPENGEDKVKNGQKSTVERKSSKLHWNGAFGTTDGDAGGDTPTRAFPKESIRPPSFHQQPPNDNGKLEKPDWKSEQLRRKQSEYNILSQHTANGAGALKEQMWNGAFDHAKHLSDINYLMKENAKAPVVEKDWQKSISKIDFQIDANDENSAASGSYLENEELRGGVSALLETSEIVTPRPAPPTRYPLFPIGKKLLASRHAAVQYDAHAIPLHSDADRRQTLLRMTAVKRRLKNNPNASQNEADEERHMKQIDAVRLTNEQMWADLIKEWKVFEERKKELMKNERQRMTPHATKVQNSPDQSETTSTDSHRLDRFLNHPRRLNTANVVVRTDRNGRVLGNVHPATQHFSSLNLNERHRTNEPAVPFNSPLRRIFENRQQETDQQPTAGIRSEGWTRTRTRQRRHFRIDDVDDSFDDIKVRYLKKMPPLSNNLVNAQGESPLTKISKLMTGIVRGSGDVTGDEVGSWKSTYKRLWRLKEQLKSWKETQQRSQAYQERRLLDMVTGNFKGREANVLDNSIPDANGFNGIGDIPLANEVNELVSLLTHHNLSKTVKFLSPRLAPLLPRDEKADGGNLLSPSLLAFYSDKSPNNIAPLPELLGATGMSEEEKDAFIEFVMELTGARDIVDKIFENLNSSQGLGGLRQDILDANDRLVNVWKQFQSSYSDRQKDDIDTKGYAFLDRQQLDLFYGQDGYYNYTKPELELDTYYQLSDEGRRASLRATIKKLAGETSTDAAMRTWDRRLQQSVLKPNVGTATVLAPFTFGPSILSPAVLGPLVLSPNIFSPGILSPYLLSPPILSPSVGDPLILSPYVLGPNILSPSVLTPYVLSPYVLSPNILNPYVLSPLILSPYLLSPDILSPTVLSGTILSPYVLSPSILSNSVLAASVLSPSVLSKK